MKKTHLLLAAAAFTLPAAALAHQPAQRGYQGDITLSQVEEQAAERFAMIDTDGDGAISQAEITALQEQRAERRAERRANRERGGQRGAMARGGGGFDRLDADGNGLVSLAEFTQPRLEMFERADADGNGVVTEAERKEARENMRERRQQRRANR